MPKFDKTFSFAGKKIRWTDLINLFSFGFQVTFDQYAVYDGYNFTVTNDAKIAYLLFGQKLVEGDLKIDAQGDFKVGFDTNDLGEEKQKKLPGLLKGSYFEFCYTLPADFSFCVGKKNIASSPHEKKLLEKSILFLELH